MRNASPAGQTVRGLSLALSLSGGAIAWTLHLVASYVLVPFVCQTGLVLLLHLFTLGAAGATLAAGAFAFRLWRRSGVGVEADARGRPGPEDTTLRTGFLALQALLLDAVFLVAILAEGIGPVFLNPCEHRGQHFGL